MNNYKLLFGNRSTIICDNCDYSKSYEMSTYDGNDEWSIKGSQSLSYCIECGFLQPKIDIKEIRFTVVEVFGESAVDAEKEIQGLLAINNHNQCRKCDGELVYIENSQLINELNKHFDYKSYEYKTTLASLCATCKEFKDSEIIREYYVDTNTKKLLKKVLVRNDECNICKTKLEKIEVKGAKGTCRKSKSIGRYGYGGYIKLGVKCPNCGSFSMKSRCQV